MDDYNYTKEEFSSALKENIDRRSDKDVVRIVAKTSKPKRDIIPYELIEALQSYLNRNPDKKNIRIHCGPDSILMGDMPNEIEQGTKIGIDYEKSLYKMAFEKVIDQGFINI